MRVSDSFAETVTSSEEPEASLILIWWNRWFKDRPEKMDK